MRHLNSLLIILGQAGVLVTNQNIGLVSDIKLNIEYTYWKQEKELKSDEQFGIPRVSIEAGPRLHVFSRHIARLKIPPINSKKEL